MVVSASTALCWLTAHMTWSTAVEGDKLAYGDACTGGDHN